MWKNILLSDIIVKNNTRSYFDENTINELAASIKAQGVLQPILVRKVGKKFELVFGERRYRASLVAELTDIPAMIRELTDEEVIEIQITENLHRDNINPLDEAIAFKLMQDKKHYTNDEIAARIGKTPGFVKSRLILNELVEDAKQLLYNGTLPVTHATKIAALQPKKQKEALNKVIVFDGDKKPIAHKPIAELNWWLKQNLIKQLDMASFDIADEKLVKGTPACLNCEKCTINVASLFPEDASNKGCLDPTCFGMKVSAHINKRIEEITAKRKEEPMKVSDVFYTSDPDVMNATKYQVRKNAEKCQMCKIGVIAHSDKGKEGEEVWVCQHSICPDYSAAESTNSVDSDERKKEVILQHATKIAEQMNMEQAYEQEYDPKMMLVVEYYQKWNSLKRERQQLIVNTLSWDYDTSENGHNEGVFTDMEMVPEGEMFHQNFHGKDREKETIDREYRIEMLLGLRDQQDNAATNIVQQTLNPIIKTLNRENFKIAKKLAEFYQNPTEKALRKMQADHLIRIYHTESSIKQLAKRFGVVLKDSDEDLEDYANQLIHAV